MNSDGCKMDDTGTMVEAGLLYLQLYHAQTCMQVHIITVEPENLAKNLIWWFGRLTGLPRN